MHYLLKILGSVFMHMMEVSNLFALRKVGLCLVQSLALSYQAQAHSFSPQCGYFSCRKNEG